MIELGSSCEGDSSISPVRIKLLSLLSKTGHNFHGEGDFACAPMDALFAQIREKCFSNGVPVGTKVDYFYPTKYSDGKKHIVDGSVMLVNDPNKDTWFCVVCFRDDANFSVVDFFESSIDSTSVSIEDIQKKASIDNFFSKLNKQLFRVLDIDESNCPIAVQVREYALSTSSEDYSNSGYKIYQLIAFDMCTIGIVIEHDKGNGPKKYSFFKHKVLN